MPRLAPKTKTLIFLGLFILGDLLILTLVIYRTVKEITYLNRVISTERSRLEARYERRTSARAIIETLNKVSADLPEREGALLHAGGELDLVTDLEEAAARHGVTQKISLSSREGKTDFGDKILLNLSLNGTFAELVRYISELEQLSITVIFDNISFSHELSASAKSEGKIRGLLQGHLYYAK